MKKKLVQINTVCNTSTGQIMHDIQQEAEKQGYDTISFVGRRRTYTDLKCEKFGNGFSFWTHVVLNTIFDCQGYGSYFATKKLIKRLKEEHPDIIHLHNLHGYYLHIPLLFEYLKKEFRGRLYWTFHDCWPFTGHCPYFVMAKCSRWKKRCYKCPQKALYPISCFLDSSTKNYRNKRQMFTSIADLTIITPSFWMKHLIKESFFKRFRVEVVSNGIDTTLFHPCHDEKELKKVQDKYHIPKEKKVLLGVASVWEKRKGFEFLLCLSDRLPQEYVLVLVGLNKKQMQKVPKKIVGIQRTENKLELAQLYSSAHIFLNPSMEESFSMVTIEALACATPVIALDTSAVKELVDRECGIILHENKVEDYLDAIKKIEQATLSKDQIAQKGLKYDKQYMVKRVLQLYEE